MYIVRNKLIPFPGYKAINICGILFVRGKANMKDTDINHEAIHSKQIFEMLIILYYIWYLIEWLIRVFFSKDRFTHQAYKNISFEQEAYNNQNNLDYLKQRKHYAWFKYLKIK